MAKIGILHWPKKQIAQLFLTARPLFTTYYQPLPKNARGYYPIQINNSLHKSKLAK